MSQKRLWHIFEIHLPTIGYNIIIITIKTQYKQHNFQLGIGADHLRLHARLWHVVGAPQEVRQVQEDAQHPTRLHLGGGGVPQIQLRPCGSGP